MLKIFPIGQRWVKVITVAKVGGYAIPGIVMVFIWIVLVVLAVILLALIVHWAGGGLLNVRIGHFRLDVGFT